MLTALRIGMIKRSFLYFFCVVLAVTAVAAKPAVCNAAEAQLPTVSLLTVGPGNDIYELEGHTELRFLYPDGRDLAVNWGLFDFDAPNFVYRFVKGETDYCAGVRPTASDLASYQYDGRRVTEQRLALSPRQIECLELLVATNLQPENRTYRYNYVKDNCATRPLALIEQALAADSSQLIINMPTEQTSFRDEMRRYHKNFPSYQFGIDLALGSGIDYAISPREQAFAPVYLERLAAGAEIVGSDGEIRPLVESETILVEGRAEAAKEQGLPPAVYVWVFAGLVVVMTIMDFRRRRVSRWFDAAMFGVYGIAGCVIAFLVFISSHEATSPNVNLLWLNPLALVVPLLIWVKSAKKIVYCYQILNFVLVLVYICGTPFFNQSVNTLFIPLAACSLLRSANYIYQLRSSLSTTRQK